MQTSKPISTISYNTKGFLDKVLHDLLRSHIIDYFMYIQHIGEIDQFGEREKDHIHLFIIPNQRINTADLDKNFLQPVPNNKPLKCISWNTSKSDDWILYVLHDPEYLASKFEHREISYKYTDIIGSNEEDLRRRYRMAYQSSGYAKMCNLYQYAKSGGKLTELMRIGAIPVNQIEAYNKFFEISKRDIPTNIQTNEQDV